MMSEYFIKPIVKTLMLKGQEGQSIKGIKTASTTDLLLGRYYADAKFNFTGNVYYLKIYEGDTLVRDFAPAVRNTDSVAGMYDKVNKKFYASESGTNFTAN